MSIKYIVMQLEDQLTLFTFPRSVDHDRMYEALGAIRFGCPSNWSRKYRDGEAISAGFITDGKCHGKSETLNLKSRPDEDTKLYKESLKSDGWN